MTTVQMDVVSMENDVCWDAGIFRKIYEPIKVLTILCPLKVVKVRKIVCEFLEA